jgi:hypothetical protein
MVDPEQIEGKAKVFVQMEDRPDLFDTLILCRFYRDLYQWDRSGGPWSRACPGSTGPGGTGRPSPIRDRQHSPLQPA